MYFFRICSVLCLLLFFSRCENLKGGNIKQTNFPVISTLFNNRMLLLLKGTYATDEPLSFDDYSNGTGNLYLDESGEGLDPTFDLAELPKASALPILIDIGEVRISSKYREGFAGMEGLTSIEQTRKFWDTIAPNRQVYCNVPYGLGSNTCQKTGYFNITDFFNGLGTQYPSNDPTAETYSNGVGTQYYYTGIYIRSMVTGFARERGALKRDERFDSYEVAGSNIVFRNNYNPNTNDIEKETKTPAMFPLFYAIQPGQKDMEIRGGFDPYILEIRMNIKENLMVHSYRTPEGADRTMVSFSDWRKPHNGEIDMGGNLLSRARVIYPETASTIYASGGTRSLTHYYAIYRAEETDLVNQLPLAASPVKQGSTKIRYIGDGEYRLLCLGDIQKADGYPETIIRETNFSVPSFPFKQSITVDLACP
jgi:hypothetical protein